MHDRYDRKRLVQVEALLLWLLLASPVWATQAFVQGNSSNCGANVLTCAVAFTANEVVDNLIVVVASWDPETATASVSDSLGNTYVSAVGPTTLGAPAHLASQIFYAKNILGGANTVTVTISAASTTFLFNYIHEYSGSNTAAPLDVTSAATGNSATLNSGSATTTAANELIFGWGLTNDGQLTKGTTFTLRQNADPSGLSEDKFVTATGAYSANGTSALSDRWIMQMATFKDATQPAAGCSNFIALLGAGCK